MAYVTYIIGNGLDLSLGLKTSYRDFYEFVKTKKLHPDNRIYKAISESPESWSDFETSLGNYTEYIERIPEQHRKEESIKFHDELEEVREDLATYLEAEEGSVENAASNVRLTATGFRDGLHIGQSQRLTTVLTQAPPALQFITLNYTKTLENILSNSEMPLRRQAIQFNSPHHIHGDLYENMTLGVSDESQLSSSLSGAEKDDLIKPALIYSMNDGRIDALEEILTRTTVLVIFGTSLGDTDKYLWQMVTEWLRLNINRHIIIHAHESSYTNSVRRSSRQQKQYISKVQDRLLRFSGHDGDVIEELKKRVFVIFNTEQLFVSSD